MMPPDPTTQPRPFRPSISALSFPTFSSPSPSPSQSQSQYQSQSSRSLSSPHFLHNTRIALTLIPSSLFLLDLGGTPVTFTLTLGLMISYILDSVNIHKYASFFGVWFSLVIASLTFLLTSASHLYVAFNSLSVAVAAMGLCSGSVFLVGVWVSLQFKWILVESPGVVVALERVLFGCLPVVGSVLFTWATVEAVGMGNAGFYFMLFNMVFYWLYSLPRVSSFKGSGGYKVIRSVNRRSSVGENGDDGVGIGVYGGYGVVVEDVNRRSSDRGVYGGYGVGGEVADEKLILGELESCVHTLWLLFGPLMFHFASHYRVILGGGMKGVSDLLLLFFVPFLFLLYASTRGALRWVSKKESDLQSIRVVNGAVALVVVVICLEVRVVFQSFGKYIQVPAPLNYVLVTVMMLGGASAVGGYAVGMVGDTFSSIMFTILAVLVSGVGAIVVGFPLLFLPLPLVAGFYLARFFTKKSLSSYFTFVLLASLMVIWFVLQNFWDLNIWLAGMSLKSFCKLITADVILAMSVPGIALLPSKFRFLTEFSVISHALLLCNIENRFFNYSNIYYFGLDDDVMYPSYMVITTTCMGLALARKLLADQRIGQKTLWILTCLYFSKLAMLFITSKSVLWVSAILLLAVSPPLLLYKEKIKGASKMKPWQGYIHAGTVALSTWFCREVIFEVLQWWNGRSPSNGLLLGFCIVLIGVACIPIVALHFPHAQTAKRCLVLVVATGLLFVLLQPPIPLSWAFGSDMIWAAHQSADDISIYGFIASKPTWPSWLLIAAVLLTLAAITSIIPVKYVDELRVFYAIGVGLALGIYISAEYFLQATMLHALLVATSVCTSVFIVFAHFPSAWSPRLLPWVFALLVALFPVTYLLEGQVRAKDFIDEGLRGDVGEEDSKLITLLAVEGARTSLLGLYAAIFMLIALEMKFELASLMHEKMQDRSVGVPPPRSGRSNSITSTNFPPKMRLNQQRRASTVPTLTIKRLAAEGAWMPSVGNVATVMCFAICLILNITLTDGSNRAIFFLAPILLLLNQDSDFVSGFKDRQRYFPVTVVITAYLILTTIYRIYEEVWHGNAGWGIEIGGPDWFFAVKNIALLMLTLPSQILFNRFVWSFTKQTDSTSLLTLPLNIPSVIITDVIKVKILGLLGMLYSLVQYLISRQLHITGLKYI